MIFQEPMTALNPVFRIGDQVDEVLALHNEKGHDEAQIKARTIELLEMVGIANSEGVYKMFPHELSGGMRQRVVIAMALACDPEVIIADEPTTALDVTIQAQILQLLKDLVQDTGTALIMITHDLGVVAGLCDEVNVMYGGRIVERNLRHDLFAAPRHPYTHGLLGSIPRLDGARGEPLHPIPGSVTDNLPWASACAFALRCSQPIDVCRTQTPEFVEDGPSALRCHNPVDTRPTRIQDSEVSS